MAEANGGITGEPAADNSSGASSTNNDFFVVNEGDITSNFSRQSSSTRLNTVGNDVTERTSLEEKLIDAAIESGEDSISGQSVQEGSGKQWTGVDKRRSDIDLVGLLVGSADMLCPEVTGAAVSGLGVAAASEDSAEEKRGEQFDNTFLHGVTYLGCSRIDNTTGAEGALNVMLDLKREAMSALPVTLAVPTNSNGYLRLITPGTEEIQFAVPIRNIACCTRGNLQEIQDCLGFVVSQPTRMPTQHYSNRGEQIEGESYLCHVVQFAALETITAALNSFSQAFGVNAMPPGGLHSILGEDPLLLVQFAVSVRENDSKQPSSSGAASGSYSPNLDMKFSQNVPRDKNCLKLRQSFLKKVEIAVRVVSEPQLPIERTCGFFVQFHDIAANVRNCNYELLDHLDTAMGYSPTDGGREMIASGILDPNLPQFTIFNSLTGKAGLLFARFALDVVFLGIETPVRFHLPVVCKILSKNERFFYPNRRPCLINYIINLKAIPDTDSSYRVEGLKCEADSSASSTGGLAGSLFGLAGSSGSANQSIYDFTSDESAVASGCVGGFNTADFFGGSEADSLHQPEDDSADEDILISGFGSVSKDCSEEVLTKWGELIKEWTNTEMPISPEATTEAAATVPSFSFGGSPAKGRPQPKAVKNLVRTVGIPEALRGEVWHRQVGTEDTDELCQKYRQYLEQECVNEDQIKRDIHRTFPANDFFKDDQGPGQEALLKLTKAYSQYDQEIGYCQGFTYIAAVLLLHMPEEQAFCVFVRLMGLFKLRELYKQDFYELKLKWFQLDYLVRDHIPTLYYHFQAIGLKSHMFSSQWFLTLYTAKFPLYLVYRIYDIIFSEGLSFLLNVALALLREASDELCRKTFEECNTYIKANIPRKYRDETAADDLIRKALQMKINQKKLAAYAKEYYNMVQREERLKDPMERLKVEQQESHAKIMSLEAEAVNLANELVNAKMDAQRKAEALEEKVSQIQAMFQSTHEELSQMQETKQQLESENEQLKKLVEFETKEANKQKEIVAEYRKLCSDRERERDQQLEIIRKLKNAVSKCPECSSQIESVLNAGGDSKNSTENGRHSNSTMSFICNNGTTPELADSSVQIEQELALTKLKLVEEQSYNQQLEHEVSELRQLVNTMNTSASNQNASSAAAQWLLKRTPSFLSRTSNNSPNHSNATPSTSPASVASSTRPDLLNN